MRVRVHVQIMVSCSESPQLSACEFQHQLSNNSGGVDDPVSPWSPWSTKGLLTLAGFLPGGSYNLRVRARDSAGNMGDESVLPIQVAACVSGSATPYLSSSSLTYSEASGGWVFAWASALDWTSGYEWRVDGLPWHRVDTTTAAVSSSGLQPGYHVFAVRARNPSQCAAMESVVLQW